MEGGKLRKCLRRKINWLRDEEGGNGASDGERGAKKRKQDGDRSVFCVCAGLFLWSSVSVFQLWTVDYSKIHKCVCLSAFFWGQLQTLMWRERPISDCLWQHSHQLGGHLQEPDGPEESLWVCTRQKTTGSLQQQSAGSHLAAIMLLHSSCSLCSVNPLLCPSTWQSYTHGATSHSLITRTHM